MQKVPSAKFSTRSTPKISDSPDAIRKRNIAAVSPLRLCANTNARSGIAREFLGDWSRELRSGRGSHGRSGQTQRSPGGGRGGRGGHGEWFTEQGPAPAAPP